MTLKLDHIVPQELIDKLNDPEVADRLKKLFSVLAVARKAEMHTDHFIIFAWTTTDTATKKRSVSFRIEEV